MRFALPLLIPTLERLATEHEFEFVVISDEEPEFGSCHFKTRFVPWNPATEVRDLQLFDLGTMPLQGTPFFESKCGGKLVQYMGVAIPAVASEVGANRQIVEPGITGFLANTSADWEGSLARLVADPRLRRRMGEAAYQRSVSLYSVRAVLPRLIRIFEDLK
jgi:glycosyltransferase involved in cell wall biosynthesis